MTRMISAWALTSAQVTIEDRSLLSCTCLSRSRPSMSTAPAARAAATQTSSNSSAEGTAENVAKRGLLQSKRRDRSDRLQQVSGRWFGAVEATATVISTATKRSSAAACYVDRGSCDITRFVRGEPHDRPCDLVECAGPAHRDAVLHALDPPCGSPWTEVSGDETRSHVVDPDPVPGDLLGEPRRQRLEDRKSVV